MRTAHTLALPCVFPPDPTTDEHRVALTSLQRPQRPAAASPASIRHSHVPRGMGTGNGGDGCIG